MPVGLPADQFGDRCGNAALSAGVHRDIHDKVFDVRVGFGHFQRFHKAAHRVFRHPALLAVLISRPGRTVAVEVIEHKHGGIALLQINRLLFGVVISEDFCTVKAVLHRCFECGAQALFGCIGIIGSVRSADPEFCYDTRPRCQVLLRDPSEIHKRGVAPVVKGREQQEQPAGILLHVGRQQQLLDPGQVHPVDRPVQRPVQADLGKALGQSASLRIAVAGIHVKAQAAVVKADLLLRALCPAEGIIVPVRVLGVCGLQQLHAV